MTPLRQRLLDEMTLRGLSPKTQIAYIAAVKGLAEHYYPRSGHRLHLRTP